jgi:hypothetical protein
MNVGAPLLFPSPALDRLHVDGRYGLPPIGSFAIGACAGPG